MKILIEDPDTSMFLASDGSWTSSRKNALGFPSSTRAREAGEKTSIGRFNVVGAFIGWPQLTNLDEGRGLRREAN